MILQTCAGIIVNQPFPNKQRNNEDKNTNMNNNNRILIILLEILSILVLIIWQRLFCLCPRDPTHDVNHGNFFTRTVPMFWAF